MKIITRIIDLVTWFLTFTATIAVHKTFGFELTLLALLCFILVEITRTRKNQEVTKK